MRERTRSGKHIDFLFDIVKCVLVINHHPSAFSRTIRAHCPELWVSVFVALSQELLRLLLAALACFGVLAYTLACCFFFCFFCCLFLMKERTEEAEED